MTRTRKTYERRWITTRAEYQWQDGKYVKTLEEGYWYAGPMALATDPPSIRTEDWAFYQDGPEASASIIGSVNTNPTKGSIPYDTVFVVRFGIEEESGNASKNTTAQLWYRHNQASPAVWTQVTTTSNVIRSTASAASPWLGADEGNTTRRLGTAYTFDSTNNGIDNANGIAGGNDADLSSTGMEVVFPVVLRSADVSADDTIDLKIVVSPTDQDGSPTPTWPTITADTQSATYQANVVASTGGVTAQADADSVRVATATATTGGATASADGIKKSTALVVAGLGTRIEGNTDPQIQSSAGWTLNFASISGGQLHLTGGGGTGKGAPPGATNIVAGRQYHVLYKATLNSGTGYFGSVGGTALLARFATGTWPQVITAVSNGTAANTYITAFSAADNVDVDFFTITEYQGGVTAQATARIQYNQADVAATTGGATAQADAVAVHVASVAATTGGVTAQADADAVRVADVTATTGAATAQADATAVRQANVAATTGSVTAQADAAIARTANVDATTSAATASADASVAKVANVAATTGGATSQADAVSVRQANVDATTGSVTASADAKGANEANVSATTASVESQADAVSVRIANVAATTGAVQASADAKNGKSADVAATTGAATAQADAVAVRVADASATTGGTRSSADGVTVHVASIAATTGGVTASGAATKGENHANVDATAGSVTANAVGTSVRIAQASESVEDGDDLLLTHSCNVGSVTASATVVRLITANVSATTGSVTASGDAEAFTPADVAATTGAATSAATGVTVHIASVAADVGAVVAVLGGVTDSIAVSAPSENVCRTDSVDSESRSSTVDDTGRRSIVLDESRSKAVNSESRTTTTPSESRTTGTTC